MSNQHALSPAAGPPAKRRRPTKKPAASQFSSGASTPPAPAPPVRAAAADLYNGATASGIVHEFCTEVQAKTLPVILTGVDVLAQAKTGTGKTVAFLVPSIERLVRSSPQPAPGSISVLILSPTRELAIQIEEEARKLCSGTPYIVQHVVGGTNMGAETKRLAGRCDILVGTPGRMIDHLENSTLKGKLSKLSVLILDEADRLLEAGFRRELVKIIDCLPKRTTQPRQTLLFSATVPEQVHSIASVALLPKFTFITTISQGDAGTHSRVPQNFLLAPLNDSFPMTLAAIRSEVRTHGAATKIMCFLPTARATGLAAALFKRLHLNMDVFEIHSRKSQSQRNAAAEAFKSSTSAVLFSSDVTARGMDFPGVTTVLQVGLPANAEQYIHRLGRTARAGAAGSGILILTPFENFFLQKREIVALKVLPHPETTLLSGPEMVKARADVRGVIGDVDDETKAQFYSATLGFYKPFIRDMFGSAENMVATMNAFSASPDGLAYTAGRDGVPGMLASTIGKMGLRGTAGLHIIHALPPKAGEQAGGAPRQGGGGGRGGGGGGRGGSARGGGAGGRGRGGRGGARA